MSWLPPNNLLDNEQLEFLENFKKHPNSNYWIKGFAGSGKSVLLVYSLITELVEINNTSKSLL